MFELDASPLRFYKSQVLICVSPTKTPFIYTSPEIRWQINKQTHIITGPNSRTGTRPLPTEYNGWWSQKTLSVYRLDDKKDNCGLTSLVLFSQSLQFLYFNIHNQEVSADKTKYMVMSRDQNAGRIHSVRMERVEEFKYLGTTLTNQNYIQEEIKSRLRSGNACYYSVQNLLSSRLLSKNLNIKIY